MQPDELQKLLAFLTSTLQEGKTFVVAEAPSFVQELLRWRYYEALFFIGLGAAFLLVGWAVGFILRKAMEDDAPLWICGIGGSAIGVLLMATNAYVAIQVQVAPRLVLVTMVRDLLTGR